METTPREASEKEWAKETAARLELKQNATSKLKDYELVWLAFHRAVPTTNADKQLKAKISRLLKAEDAVAVTTADLASKAAVVSAWMAQHVRKRCEPLGRLALELNLAKMSPEDEAELRALVLQQRARRASAQAALAPIELELPAGMGSKSAKSRPISHDGPAQ